MSGAIIEIDDNDINIIVIVRLFATTSVIVDKLLNMMTCCTPSSNADFNVLMIGTIL